jgi:hypothetical protein
MGTALDMMLENVDIVRKYGEAAEAAAQKTIRMMKMYCRVATDLSLRIRRVDLRVDDPLAYVSAIV